jgi:cytochrome c oxidase subunit I
MQNKPVTVPSHFRLIILVEILFPVVLLILGVYHGLIQTLYRAGIIRSESFLGLDYYQGLTLHGVVNAIVFTTMFSVAFGQALVLRFLGEPNKTAAWTSFGLMMGGTALAAWAMLVGKASVLYTFYPPLKAHPLFYIGATMLVVGSWVAFFSWVPVYTRWRRENPGQKTPMAIVGIFSAFIVWFTATVPLAVEILFLILPWSFGWVDGINVTLSRILFWFFGHPLVYFWLLPAYTMYYVMLPKLAGGKLYSDKAGRLVFMTFIFLSAPLGLHHQYGDPSISTTWKWIHGLFTFAVAIPSFLTAFTLAASLEHGAQQRGGKGLFAWWSKLPYFDSKNYLFGYFFCGLLLFLVGGVTGIINSSLSMNNVVHNTSWVPGHFHTTLGGPTYLAFTGMSLYLVSQLTGKKVAFPRLNVSVPYLWLIGTSVFCWAMSSGGLSGQPRRTNLGLTYTDPNSPLYQSDWMWTAMASAAAGVIMFVSFAIFFVVVVGTLLKKTTEDQTLDFPVSEAYHNEPSGVFTNFTPWLVTAVIFLILAYTPPLLTFSDGTFENSPRFQPNSPIAEPLSKPVAPTTAAPAEN